MSHEAIVAGYADQVDGVVLAGVQVVCECGVIIAEADETALGFIPLSDVNHAVRMHQEATNEP